MLINFVDATNDVNHYTKPPPPMASNMYHVLRRKMHKYFVDNQGRDNRVPNQSHQAFTT